MVIGILCNKDINEAVYRITFSSIVKASSQLDFECVFVEDLTSYPDIIFSNGGFDPTSLELNSFLTDCKSNGVKIITIFNDVYPGGDNLLQKWSKISDCILCPTLMHKLFIESLIDTPVEILNDSIDYTLTSSHTPLHKNEIPKICWFGYPESYHKSIHRYEHIIKTYVDEGLMSFTLITDPKLNANFPISPFNSSTFMGDIKKFDGCILSHSPLDYNINTFVKSPNKLTLAITLGVPCIASNTPSYKDILNRVGLSDYLFSNTNSFNTSLDLLININKEKYLSKSQQYILDTYNYLEIAKHFIKIVKKLT